jgi:DNA invertase Pin-like site-specific DNA recombinase
MTIYELLEGYRTANSIYEMPLRVAYYARVSSEKDEQLHSLDNQIDYYEGLIRRTTCWTFGGSYVDEGITGTSALRREAFLQMIRDGEAGKFDLVITKEISRFARNTLDSIAYTRQLFAAGVGVYFENDNINTLSSDGELRLTILSSIAQDEVRKLSQRVRYGFRVSQDKGVVLGNNAIWGYTKEKGTLKPCPEEAAVVQTIFDLYAHTDLGLRKISAQLAEEGVVNRNGKPFSYSTLRSILSNPKYKGYYCGRKTSAPPLFLPQGGGRQQLPQQDWLLYPAEEKVPPLVSEETWEKANEKLASRGGNQKGQRPTGLRQPLSGKIRCARHGTPYYRTISRTSRGQRPVWMCSCYQRYGKDPEKGCDQPLLYEEELLRGLALALEVHSPNRQQVAKKLQALYQTQGEDSGDRRKWEAALRKEEERQARLLELRLDGELTALEYQRRKEVGEETLCRLRAQLNQPQEELPWETILAAIPEPRDLPQERLAALLRKGRVTAEKGITLHLILWDGSQHEVSVNRRRGQEPVLVLLPSECSEQGT